MKLAVECRISLVNIHKAKAGKSLVKVARLNAPLAGQIRRLGFMEGQIAVSDDFDSMGSKEIEQLFGDEE